MTDWAALEAKWRSRWKEARAFESDPDGRQKKFVTVAYPYPNSPQHVGHGRTYTLADAHARFLRMRGYNVLFPMAFHYTGTPILGMARRVAAGDAEIISNLKGLYGVPEGAVRGFEEPVKIADYFRDEIKSGMDEMGYSIDWRREFTTVDPGYKKFIGWQVERLRRKGLIIQGSHPVGWCPRDENPVSQHDTMGDVEPEIVEYTVVKFRAGRYVLPAATLRPETLFGVTNLWVDPEAEYQKVEVGGETWLASAECLYKMGFLGMASAGSGAVKGSEILEMSAEAPQVGRAVPVLPAKFVQQGTGTGIVMSVPAHAPFDMQALLDAKRDGVAGAGDVEPVRVIGGGGELPASEALRSRGVKDQGDPRIEEATKEVYNAEFYGGSMNEKAGRFAGMPVAEAKSAVRELLLAEGGAVSMLELAQEPKVRCRCGAECVVKVLSDQWFLNYADEEWKARAASCMESMSVLPPELRQEFSNVLGWLRERACARQRGMGTKLPWDDGWIVESLSDSVIYMAYYTIAGLVGSGRISPDSMTRGFFDYAFLGEGDPARVAAEAGLERGALDEARRQFLYFYPVDSRHSGRDLVPNHLTFFVLNHVAMFPEGMWPAQIVVNGSVLMDGSKMSKSMGNIIPLRSAIRRHGADPIRLAIVISAELLQDADFREETVAGIRARLEAMVAEAAPGGGGPGPRQESRWLADRAAALVEETAASMEKMRLREALHGILYSLEADLAWYRKRAGAAGAGEDAGLVHAIRGMRASMLWPFAPHAAEEIWEKLGNPGSAGGAWPEPPAQWRDAGAFQAEELLRSTLADIARILKVTKISPRSVTAYAAGAEKRALYGAVLRCVCSGDTSMGQVMKKLVSDPKTAGAKKCPALVQKMVKDILSDPVPVREARLAGGFDEARFLAEQMGPMVRAEFGAEFAVVAEDAEPGGKAAHARPFKPALLVE